MNAAAVLKVADGVRDARAYALEAAARHDRERDPIGAAYAEGMLDALDASWACELEAAAGCGAGDLSHALDMAAFGMAGLSVASSDMLSALAASVKAGDRESIEAFERKWLKAREAVG